MSLTLNFVYFTGYRNYRRADFTCICQYVFQNHVKSRTIYVWAMPGASPGFERGGGARIFFQIWELHVAKLGGSGLCSPRNFFKTVQFCAF